MTKKMCFALAVVLITSVSNFAQVSESLPSFEDYSTPVYKGKIKRPKWILYNRQDGWRDSLGKLVESPTVNFSGKYFATVHSCGTGCRYYTVTDLTTGKELDMLRGFGAGEEPPTTKDGLEYRETLYFLPNSRLLIAQYEVYKSDKTECR